jgi:uridine kinase
LDHPVRVGIDGVDASGKTTLANKLAEQLSAAGRSVVRASIDGFHNPRAVRYRLGPDSPEGYYRDSFNLTAVRRNLLDPLGPGGDRRIATALFDFRSDSALENETIEAAPDAVLLFDGVFLHRPELAECWEVSIFLKISFSTMLERAARRDSGLFGSVEAVRDRYTKRYIPAQKIYLAECQPEKLASVVVDFDML